MLLRPTWDYWEKLISVLGIFLKSLKFADSWGPHTTPLHQSRLNLAWFDVLCHKFEARNLKLYRPWNIKGAFIPTHSLWTTIDNSRHYKNNLLTDGKVLRLSATFKLSFRTIFCGTNWTVSCLHLRWLTCGVGYCDCGECGCGTSRNGRGLLPIGDNSYGPRPSYLQL